MPHTRLYVPPGRRDEGCPGRAKLHYEPLGHTHLSDLMNASDIYRGRHRNPLGGSWNKAELKRRIDMAEDDRQTILAGKKAGGYYWAVRQGGNLIGLVGMHQNGAEGDPYVHRIFVLPKVTKNTQVRIVRHSLQLFANQNPSELCVWTNSPGSDLYVEAGFILLAKTPVARKNNKRYTKRMSFLVADLSTYPTAQASRSRT